MTNPLVAERQDSTKASSGVQIAESVAETQKAVESGDWAGAVLGVVGTALDALGMAMDPFGAILSAGVGWLIEHVGPLSDALDALTGDPDQIKAHSQTWKNVAGELTAIKTELADSIKKDTEQWQGAAADAYRKRGEETGNLLTAAESASAGAADGVGTAGEVVGAVRTLVRDIIADLVGHLVSWALQVAATLGVAMAWVVPQVVNAVAKTASQIADITKKLVQAMKKLTPLLKKLGNGFKDASNALKKIKADGGKADGPKPPPAGKDKGGDPPPKNEGPAGTSSQGTGGPPKNDGPPPKNTPPPTERSPDSGGATPTPPPKSPPKKQPAQTNPSGARNDKSNPRSLDNMRTCGDPIDVSTGQMVMVETDVRLEGALPLEISRSHFSRYRLGRWLGRSWMSTLDERVEVDGSGISYVPADGTLQHFPHPSSQAWIHSEDGPRRSLARLDDGGYLIENAEGTLLLYFAPGGSVRSLTAMVDRDGNRIDFSYDESGVPKEIWHSGGYRVRVETADDRIAALHSVAADGTEVELMRYGYTHGQLTEVINESGLAMRFEYDSDGRIVSWTDRNNEWYRYTYDETGRCVRTEGAGGFLNGTMEYDTENRITHATNSLGHRTTFHMNEAGQVIKEVDPLGNTTTSEWDTFDGLLRRTDPLGRTTSYEYDTAGRILAITRPDGNQLRYEYDEIGRLITFTEADGTVSRREYDENGQLAAITNATGATTRYAYDERGDLIGVTDALGHTARIDSDANGLTTAMTDPKGAVTRYERDRFGRVTAIVDPVGDVQRFGWTVAGDLAWQQSPDGTTERYIYDGEGNMRESVDEFGETTRTELTHFDLVAAETRPDGTRLAFAYDTEMRLTGVTNQLGQVWRYEYDQAGNMVRETDFNGSTIHYRFDAAGQLVERINGAGELSRFSYDLMGNQIQRSDDQGTTTFTYGLSGDLLEATDSASQVSFQRDPLGRVLAETINGRTVTFVYDPLGRLIRRRTPSGAESTWEYDGNDQPITLHSAGQTIRFEHDLLGREVRLTLASGLAVDQEWTPAQRLRSQRVVAPTGQAVQRRSYTYRADGELTALQDELTGPRTYAMDHAGQVTAVQAARWTESYTYDPAGNVTTAVWPTSTEDDQLGGRHYRGGTLHSAGHTRYEYDARGRLVLRQRPSGTCRYSWDSEDRLVGVLRQDGVRWRYRYDALGRRIAKERLDGARVVERIDFTWDGSVLIEQASFDGSHSRVMAWDYEPGSYRPLTQRERLLRSPQEWTDERFYIIVTDLLGTPTELVDDQGNIPWVYRASLWGNTFQDHGTPLRFPGQYFDAETGLHHNFHRYYDPATARYLSPDPIGLEGGANNYAYVNNPHTWSDPLGLKKCRDSEPKLTKEERKAKEKEEKRKQDIVKKHQGTAHTSGQSQGYKFPTKAAAGRAAREIVGPLRDPLGKGKGSQPIRKWDFKGGPKGWDQSNRIIGRATKETIPNTKQTLAGWRDDRNGHEFGDGDKVQPHFNVWKDGKDDNAYHLFYDKKNPK